MPNRKGNVTNATGKGGFVKGKSGNPTGRPKSDIQLRDMARKWTSEIMNVFYEIATDKSEKGTTRVAAGNALMDRGYGRPAQSLQIKGGGPGGLPLGLNVAFIENVNMQLPEKPVVVIEAKKEDS